MAVGRRGAFGARTMVGLAIAAASAISIGVLAPVQGDAAARSAPRTCNTPPLCAIWSVGIGSVGFSSPTFATIDGVRAIVAASLNGRVYVLNAVTHQPLPGWQGGRPVIVKGSTPTAVDSSPAVAYLDGPTKPPSIIVGAGSQYRPNQNGGVVAFNANGTARFVVHTTNTFNQWGTSGGSIYDNSVFATPAVGDIEGNGQLDVIFSSYDHHIYAVNAEGKMLPGFPIARADTIWSSAVLADTSHTGRDDIIVGGDASGYEGCHGGWVTDYRWDGAGPRLVWQRCIGETVWSSPTVGVLNSTGREAVVVGTSFDSQTPSYLTSPAAHEIFAWYADNGSPVPGWPVNAGGSCNDPANFPAGGTFGSPAIAQITAKGPPVVISTSHAHCGKGPAVVSEWNGAGKELWTTVFNKNNETMSSPAVVDMTGKGVNDVVVGAADGMVILNGQNGGFLYGTGTFALAGGCDVSGAPAVSPVPGSGLTGWELAFACGGAALLNGSLVAYALPKPPGLVPGWPEWRANPQRSGVSDPVEIGGAPCVAPALPVGFRLVTQDGQEIAGFGNLPSCGDARAAVLPVHVVAEAATPDGGGYWLLLADGAVYPFGDARSYGDARTGTYKDPARIVPPGAPMTGIASTPDGKGYYLTDAVGDVYAFGDASYAGSRSGAGSNGEVVGIAAGPKGGYWLLTSTGEVYSYGGASNHGSALGESKSPFVAMAAAAGLGYWLVTQSGAVYHFGAPWYGAANRIKHAPIVGILAGPGGVGYYLVASDGSIFNEGKALSSYGSGAGKPRDEPVVAISGP